MDPEPLIPAHVSADTYGRITMPKQFSDSVPWITGTVPFQAWLLLIQLGRYRLLSDEQVQSDPLLEPVRLLILGGKSEATSDPTYAEEAVRAALVARLAPTTLSPPKPGWRISIPKALAVFAPPDSDLQAFSILRSLEGYLEIWYTDVLRKFGTVPLQTLPGR